MAIRVSNLKGNLSAICRGICLTVGAVSAGAEDVAVLLFAFGVRGFFTGTPATDWSSETATEVLFVFEAFAPVVEAGLVAAVRLVELRTDGAPGPTPALAS
eukprot:m.323124 g.323124  ORF g.323124 m.323124 type:complete len:101 (+) comp55520_c0_seq6:593-895(+)